MAKLLPITGTISVSPDPKKPEKYPRIQPAVAIKPKPVPIAVLPKPSNQPISTFDPNSRTSSLKNDISLNINTSKRWVLPPRPRPGRKPTDECPKRKKPQKCGGTSASGTEGKDKIQSENTASSSNAHTTQATTTSAHTSTNPSHTGHKCSPYTTPDSSSASPVRLLLPTDSEEVNKLKLDYLAKLKEQQLILNYMEVINKQIEELKFVQSGVITFDALDGVQGSSRHHQNRSPEQLEKINNINDLEKFLAFFTKSSNIIHSVTKKYMSLDLNEQLEQYLELRDNWKREEGNRRLSAHLQLQAKSTLKESTRRCLQCDSVPCFCAEADQFRG